ncbi:MAG: hypothetical protein IBJ07_08005 [Rhizobiaceae bacterium]|nr:hypothetical protein [Rhizobiaceae bacterium]
MLYRSLMRNVRLAALALSLAAGVSPGWAAPESITVALPGDFPSLNPSRDTSPLGFNYRLNVFDQLTALQQNGDMRPRLAEEWSFSEDLTEWTFKLRDDVKFHDGSPLTAKDVVWTVEYILNDPQSPTRTFLNLVSEVELVDDRTVLFRLKQPYAIFHRQISFINIMPQAYFEEVGEEGFAAKPIGSGPYRVVEWIKDDRLVLEANADYWGGAPAIKTATFRPIPAEASRAASLASGEVDLVTSLPPSLLEQMRNSPGIEAGQAPGSRVIFAAFNVNTPPLDNAKVREAIDVAIDREAIAQQLLRGLGKATGMMIPPNNIGYDPSFTPTPYDPELAKKLVAESGYAGETISIQYPSNNIVMANEVVQAIAGYMTAAGLKVDIQPLEFTAFFPLWLQTKLDSMYMFAYGSTQYHGDTILTSMYEEGSRIYKVNPRIDELVKLQRTQTDVEEQKGTISEIFKLSNEDRYELPLYDEMQAFGMKEGLGYEPWPDGFVRLYEFE